MELDELGNVDIVLEAISQFLAAEDWFWFMYISLVTISILRPDLDDH